MNVGLVGAAWRRPRLAFPARPRSGSARHSSAGARREALAGGGPGADATSVRREFFLEEETSTLRVEFRASSERMLRVALSSFFDMSKVVLKHWTSSNQRRNKGSCLHSSRVARRQWHHRNVRHAECRRNVCQAPQGCGLLKRRDPPDPPSSHNAIACHGLQNGNGRPCPPATSRCPKSLRSSLRWEILHAAFTVSRRGFGTLQQCQLMQQLLYSILRKCWHSQLRNYQVATCPPDKG